MDPSSYCRNMLSQLPDLSCYDCQPQTASWDGVGPLVWVLSAQRSAPAGLDHSSPVPGVYQQFLSSMFERLPLYIQNIPIPMSTATL
ncbi:hypothetical protein PM082_015705 [Marasmius tenuissimus]|nr:hypothetical protein PM082_015705 [Marasmius tenuissimus]